MIGEEIVEALLLQGLFQAGDLDQACRTRAKRGPDPLEKAVRIGHVLQHLARGESVVGTSRDRGLRRDVSGKHRHAPLKGKLAKPRRALDARRLEDRKSTRM